MRLSSRVEARVDASSSAALPVGRWAPSSDLQGDAGREGADHQVDHLQHVGLGIDVARASAPSACALRIDSAMTPEPGRRRARVRSSRISAGRSSASRRSSRARSGSAAKNSMVSSRMASKRSSRATARKQARHDLVPARQEVLEHARVQRLLRREVIEQRRLAPRRPRRRSPAATCRRRPGPRTAASPPRGSWCARPWCWWWLPSSSTERSQGAYRRSYTVYQTVDDGASRK